MSKDQTLEDRFDSLVKRYGDGLTLKGEPFITDSELRQALLALVKAEVEKAKQELREKFGIDSSKKYDVKIGNGVIVLEEVVGVFNNMKLKVDQSLPEGSVRFEYPDGRSEVFNLEAEKQRLNERED